MPISQSDLFNQNPWWENSAAIEADPKIITFANSLIKRLPDCVQEITHAEPFSLFIMRGPRQAGKTTALKLAVRQLLKKYPPQNIFFFELDQRRDSQTEKGRKKSPAAAGRAGRSAGQ